MVKGYDTRKDEKQKNRVCIVSKKNNLKKILFTDIMIKIKEVQKYEIYDVR